MVQVVCTQVPPWWEWIGGTFVPLRENGDLILKWKKLGFTHPTYQHFKEDALG